MYITLNCQLSYWWIQQKVSSANKSNLGIYIRDLNIWTEYKIECTCFRYWTL